MGLYLYSWCSRENKEFPSFLPSFLFLLFVHPFILNAIKRLLKQTWHDTTQANLQKRKWKAMLPCLPKIHIQRMEYIRTETYTTYIYVHIKEVHTKTSCSTFENTFLLIIIKIPFYCTSTFCHGVVRYGRRAAQKPKTTLRGTHSFHVSQTFVVY